MYTYVCSSLIMCIMFLLEEIHFNVKAIGHYNKCIEYISVASNMHQVSTFCKGNLPVSVKTLTVYDIHVQLVYLCKCHLHVLVPYKITISMVLCILKF